MAARGTAENGGAAGRCGHPQPLTASDLAAPAAVSPATPHRHFQAELGTRPPPICVR
ncbi:helix-turn-helix transcriptional regulator [Streptomyces venezuelae]|uniref:hypothetical protein n=1 Tax=Streptomyces venezuelae TaxID=54571 RepID=UPI001CCCAAA9|nr:hypothetical protein [Streptomyces venezuelae]